MRWLTENRSLPVFLFLHFFDVHQYAAPERFAARYRSGDAAVDVEISKVAPNLFESLSSRHLREVVDRYDGALTYVDTELGRLFDYLRSRDRYDSSLIIVTSDHGEESWDHEGTGHGFTLYEEQLRVPLIVKPPAGTPVATSVSHEAAGVIDILPTVLDYVGNIGTPPVQGVSLRQMVEGEPWPSQRVLFAESAFFFNSYAVVRGDQKLVANRIPPVELFHPGLLLANLRSFYRFRSDELFQLVSDPHEQQNLILQREGATTELWAELRDHMRDVRRGERLVLDPEMLEELKALGYIR